MSLLRARGRTAAPGKSPRSCGTPGQLRLVVWTPASAAAMRSLWRVAQQQMESAFTHTVIFNLPLRSLPWHNCDEAESHLKCRESVESARALCDVFFGAH